MIHAFRSNARSTTSGCCIIASLLVLASGVGAQEGAASSDITFAATVHDFGPVMDVESYQTTFPFVNSGSGSLVIEQVKAGCGCTTPELEKKVFAPGEASQIRVNFKPKGTGRQTKRITVYSNDPDEPVITLAIKADITSFVTATPRMVRFQDATTGSGFEAAAPIASSALLDGSVSAISRNDLMTGELFLRRPAWDGTGFEVEFLMGYHATRLDDLIDVTSNSTVTGTGGPFTVGTTVDATDQFEARNSFHGGSLGLSADFHRGNVHFKALGKISLGNMNQQVMINGSNTVTPSGGSATTTAGGLLAQPTNIGDYERNEFVYVPEVMMTVAYDWRENIQLTAGYSFTYWSRICLAGDQIDRRVNTTQLNGGTLSGNAFPEFSFQDTDFWLQGIRLGFNWAY